MIRDCLATIVAIALMLPIPASAQLTWDTNGKEGTGTWDSVTTNWYNGTSNVAWMPGGTGTFTGIATPGTSQTHPTTVTISGTQIVSALYFNNTPSPFDPQIYLYLSGGALQSPASGLTINISGSCEVVAITSEIAGGPLTVTGSGRVGLSGVNSYSGGTIINNKALIDLSGSTTLGSGTVVNNGRLSYFNASPITENNPISGTGDVVNVSSSQVTFTAANCYSGRFSAIHNSTTIVTQSTSLMTLDGSTTIASGPLGIGNLQIFGPDRSGVVSLKDNGTHITLANSLILEGPIVFGSDGAGSLTFDGTTLTNPAKVFLGGVVSLTVNNTTTIADNIFGIKSTVKSALVKSGSGTLILNGSNSFSDGVELATGLLLINNTAGSATGSGTFTSDSGSKLGGTGIINSTTNVINGMIQGGAPGAATTGSLTLTSSGTTTFGSSANLVFNLAASGNSNKLNVSKSAVLISGSTLTLNLIDSSTFDYTKGLHFVLIAADGDTTQFSGITIDRSNHISGLNLSLVGTAINGKQNSVYYADSYLFLNNGNIEAVIVKTTPKFIIWLLISATFLLGALAFWFFWKYRRRKLQ